MALYWKFNPLGLDGALYPIPGVRGVFVSSGNVVVSSAMTLSGGTVGDQAGTIGKTVEAYSRGVAVGQTIGRGGIMRAYPGGLLADISITSGGFATVLSGGSATNVSLSMNTDAILYVSGAVTGIEMSRGKIEVRSNGIVNSARCSGGYTNISGGGAVNDSFFIGGATVSAYTDGVVNRCTIHSARIDGGTICNCTFSGAITLSRGFASDTVCHPPAHFRIGGGIASNTTMQGSSDNANCSMSVSSGGVAIGGNQTDAFVTVYRGGILSGFSGGPRISSGASGNDITVTSRATARVFAGGLMTTGTVLSGGNLQVSAGVVSNVTVLSGGSMTVYSGGSSIDTTVADGANVDVKPGGVITYKQ